MSLARTLIKVAIGIAVAKGVSTLAKKGMAGGGVAADPGTGSPYGGKRQTGLEDIFQDALGDSSQDTAPTRGAQSGGSLEDLLGGLTGTKGNASRPSTRSTAPAGGLEDLLGGLLGGKSGGMSGGQSGAGGGLGDLLGTLLGAKPAAEDVPVSRGSAGADNPLADVLGKVLGAGGGAAAGGALANARARAEAQRSSRDDDLAAALILRAMVQAAKADGDLDDEEKRKLLKNMGDASKEEVVFVTAELKRAADIDGLARQVPAGMEEKVYAMSLLAINLDNQTEAQYLHDLATALELSNAEVNALHDKAGAPRIYR